MLTLLLLLLSSSSLLNVLNLCSSFEINHNEHYYSLLWGPVTTTKTPFITFMNDFNLPSWTSRDAMSKNIKVQTLTLRKDAPFSIFCGACFQETVLESELSLTINVSNRYKHVSMPLINKQNKKKTFSLGLNQCLITYTLIEPLKENSIISCTLTRKQKETKHKISIRLLDDKVSKPPPPLLSRIYISKLNDAPLKLNCRPKTLNGLTIRHVMTTGYEKNKNKLEIYPILNFQTNLIIHQPLEREYICYFFYNNNNDAQFHKTIFQVKNINNNNNKEYVNTTSTANTTITANFANYTIKYNNHNDYYKTEDNNNNNNNINIPTTLFIISVLAIIVIGILFLSQMDKSFLSLCKLYIN